VTAARFTVRGRVQGVGFRWFVVQAARSLGLRGEVANRPDGSVEVLASGPPAALEQLQDALAAGPPAAIVTDVGRVEILDEECALTGFTIRR